MYKRWLYLHLLLQIAASVAEMDGQSTPTKNLVEDRTGSH